MIRSMYSPKLSSGLSERQMKRYFRLRVWGNPYCLVSSLTRWVQYCASPLSIIKWSSSRLNPCFFASCLSVTSLPLSDLDAERGETFPRLLPCETYPATTSPTRIPTCLGTSFATYLPSSSTMNLSLLSASGLPLSFDTMSLASFRLLRSTRPVIYSAILFHGAFWTFSKIANLGSSCSKYSTAAMKVWPDCPLSSMSFRLVFLSIEKSLHDVPATKRLESGIVCSRP
mmetsp:Transcript_29307/g.69764  ORF Transcript_29307/g.69764 Transcript_29307/m.69764 type:complete len:228 (-) Transcript_29307:1645-2328(-)